MIIFMHKTGRNKIKKSITVTHKQAYLPGFLKVVGRKGKKKKRRKEE